MDERVDILLVDDDADIRDALRIILEGEGFSVRLATDGSEALEALEERVPSLMILDVMMATETEGFDLAFEIKKMPGLVGLPIILLTSFMEKVRKDGPEEFQHILGEEWPARWLFEKPVQPQELLDRIDAILCRS